MITNLSVTERKLITNNLLELTNMLMSFLNVIKQDINDYKRSNLQDMLDQEVKFNSLFDLTSKQIMEFFTYFPLAKDLRRNVSYLHISDDLGAIKKNIFSIYYFVSKAIKKNIELIWIEKILKKMTKRLNLVYILIDNEDYELAKIIIEGDKTINDLYQEFLINNHNIVKIRSSENNSKMTDEVEIEKTLKKYNIKFVLAVKNIERIGDLFKEIAKWTYFTQTGKFYVK